MDTVKNEEGAPAPTPKKEKGAIFWMLFPVVLLVVSSTGWLIMVSVAVNDPGFAVERDYYKKASNYDDVIQQRQQNDRLKWRVALVEFSRKNDDSAILRLAIRDAESLAVSGAKVSVSAFHNARASDIQELSLTPDEKGEYWVELERPRVGLWELRVRVEKEEVFTQVLRPELRRVGAGGPPS